MRVIRLFTSNHLLSSSSELELDERTRHYALNVLRLNKHSNLIIFNGDGFDYVCEILVCNKSNLRVKVSEKRTLNNESPLKTHLYLGISKSSHMDFAIQKSVETGVTSIQPVMMERTVSKSSNKSLANKHQHWKRIIQSACEQCGRATVPELQKSIELHDIEPLLDNELGLVFDSNSSQNIQSLKLCAPKVINLLIGPEGGLSEREIQQALQKGFQAVHCGPRVLRTETAAVAAVLLAQREWGDLAQ